MVKTSIDLRVSRHPGDSFVETRGEINSKRYFINLEVARHELGKKNDKVQ